MVKRKVHKVVLLDLKEVQGQTFFEAEHVAEKDSCCEGSEWVTLHFSNGKEINIYVDGQGDVIVEAD